MQAVAQTAFTVLIMALYLSLFKGPLLDKLLFHAFSVHLDFSVHLLKDSGYGVYAAGFEFSMTFNSYREIIILKQVRLLPCRLYPLPARISSDLIPANFISRQLQRKAAAVSRVDSSALGS